MEKNVIISIKGVQRLEDADPDTMELVTEGRLEQDGNSYTLSYQESELTGLEGTLTTFQVEPDRVTLLRVGEFNSQMVFQEGRRHIRRTYKYDIVVYQEIGCLPNCNPEQPNQIFTYSCDVICRLIHEGCLRS